eukprot:2953297-Amphidinium_carterae.1
MQSATVNGVVAVVSVVHSNAVCVSESLASSVWCNDSRCGSRTLLIAVTTLSLQVKVAVLFYCGSTPTSTHEHQRVKKYKALLNEKRPEARTMLDGKSHSRHRAYSVKRQRECRSPSPRRSGMVKGKDR